MNKLLKAIIVIFAVIIGLAGVWFSLDNTAECYIIYGKNICNFYAMMDISPSIDNFDEMMNLCRDMYDVPKKDGCFEVVAQAFVRIDMNKAREACNEIREIKDQAGNIVHTKNRCYTLIEM